jgi:DNA-binding MarR family transcriptional regulator
MSSSRETLDLELCSTAAKSCACFQFRKASRAVTQHYDEILQPTGLRSTQLVILLAIVLNPDISPAGLARQLVMDRSTLVRNLKPLEKRGLIVSEPGRDRRTRSVNLTESGQNDLARALPYWNRAQKELLEGLGQDMWQGLQKGLESAVQASRRSVG